MDLKIAARMTAVLALGAAVTAPFMVLRGNGLQDASPPRSAHPGGEPAKVELARCRDIGIAAASDEACRRAWAENRRHFLQSSRPVAPYAAPSVKKDQSRLSPLQPFAMPGKDDQIQPPRVAP